MIINVVSQRYTKGDMEANRLMTTVSYDKGKVEYTSSSPFIEIGDRNLRLRNFKKHVPITTRVEGKIKNSIEFRVLNSKFVRYDIESGTMILNVPNNPTAANTAFVTRNLNTRMSENVGLSVSTI